MKLGLQLSCYNGGEYLPTLFASLAKQTNRDWHLFVLDNASNQRNAELIRTAVAESNLPITLHRVEQNIGFAGAHNFLFKKQPTNVEAIQLLNDDAFLEPTYLETCLTHLESHPTCASVEGIVFRWNYAEKNNATYGKTTVIDTLGLRMSWNGFISDGNAGEDVSTIAIPTTPFNVLGVSGCLPMYRVTAIQQVSGYGRDQGALFDPTYRIYKEDCDLAMRLHAIGYTATVVPQAIAYHRRRLGDRAFSLKSFMRPINENTALSYRNHLWLLIGHIPVLSLCTNRIGIIPFEIAKLIYWLIRSPRVVFNAIRETSREWTHLLSKRTFISELRRNGPALRDTTRPPAPQCDIAIIMVSHNDLSETCLKSFAVARSHTQHSTCLVVVDNKSTEYHANEFVEQIIPDAWTLLRNGDHGYGRSMNLGAKQVDARYYFILNPDTELIDADLFNKLFDYMQSHPDVGLVGPKIVSFQGEVQDTCRQFPTWYQPIIQRTSLKQSGFGLRYATHFLMKDFDHETEKAVDWVQGSAMFIPSNTWKQLGGFDDRFWLYFEDIDLCRRVWLLGKRVIYLPSISLRHAHGRQSALIQNFIINFIKTKETRGHIASWIKYLLKWCGQSTPRNT